MSSPIARGLRWRHLHTLVYLARSVAHHVLNRPNLPTLLSLVLLVHSEEMLRASILWILILEICFGPLSGTHRALLAAPTALACLVA